MPLRDNLLSFIAGSEDPFLICTCGVHVTFPRVTTRFGPTDASPPRVVDGVVASSSDQCSRRFEILLLVYNSPHHHVPSLDLAFLYEIRSQVSKHSEQDICHLPGSVKHLESIFHHPTWTNGLHRVSLVLGRSGASTSCQHSGALFQVSKLPTAFFFFLTRDRQRVHDDYNHLTTSLTTKHAQTQPNSTLQQQQC